MPVDLHTHSVASDGSEKPGEVVRLAAEAGLTAVALTDHDILSGIEEARGAAERYGIELVPGVELSLDWSTLRPDADRRGSMHLIVLWLEDRPGPLQDRLFEFRQGRNARNRLIVERLRSLGIDIPLDEVMERAQTGSVGRPHIAAVMVDRGYVPDIAAAFDLYLGTGRPAYVGRPRLTPAEAIPLALASGGVPVLAHPHTLGLEGDAHLERTLGELRALGLIGMETDHSAMDPPTRRRLRRMATRVGLLPSGGSDFHGTYKPGIAIGVGCGDLEVPDAYLEALLARRPDS